MDDEGEGVFNPSGFAGSTATGGGGGASQATKRTRYNRHSKDKKKKRAVASKDTQSQNEGSASDVQDTIFVRASRLVYSFCENNKC